MKVKAVDTERYERMRKRSAIQELEKELSTIVDAEIETFVRNEVKVLVKKQLHKSKQYFKPCSTSEEQWCN